jgi:hypothetical protein
MAGAVALAWWYYLTLPRRGKDPGAFVTTLARRAAGAERVRDTLSPLATLRGRVRVDRLGARVERDVGRRPGRSSPRSGQRST